MRPGCIVVVCVIGAGLTLVAARACPDEMVGVAR
jgi:hypothetical protein